MATVNVDLKWSLWSADEDVWDAEEPGLWGTEGTFYTTPRKESTYGVVTVSRVGGPWAAEVDFSAEWDDGSTTNVRRTVVSATYQEMMEAVDQVEYDLLAADQQRLRDTYLNGDGRSETEGDWRLVGGDDDGMNADRELRQEEAEGDGWRKPEI